MLAVDLPFLPLDVLRALVAIMARAVAEQSSIISLVPSPQRIACILPQLDGLPQPLCGLYHRALLPGLQAALGAGKFKVMAAVQEACGRVAPTSDLQSARGGLCLDMWDARAFAAAQESGADPSEWFLNINTPEEWQQARQIRSR
jgi:molybdopterin-guanine dinucleotide biosynthesis protein A